MLWVYFLLVTTVRVNANITASPENLISPCTDKYHMFLAPGVLTAGGTNRACISRFYTEGPARLLLTLVTEDRQTVTANRDLPPGDGGCLDVSVPLQPNTKAELIVTLRYPEAKCTWERRMMVRISSGRVMLVHTERARYRPGDTLRFRVYSFKADLSPAQESIDEIWVEGPRGAWDGTRVTQWTHVRTRMGLVQLQYGLDELAPAGRWSVRARLGDGSQGTAVFMVGSYELPPFQLSVRHAPRVLRTSERLVWTVCVRYPWMEAVEGMLVIRLRGAGNSGSHSGIRTAVRIRAPRACHRHAAASRRIGLDGSNPPDVIIADFSFQEEGTRMWQNTTVMSRVVDKAISLEFLTKHRAVISPGLPYKLKVQARRWDDKPATNEQVVSCRHAANAASAASAASVASVAQQSRDAGGSAVCVSADTDDAGIARLMFAPGDDVTPYYRFEASLANDSSVRAAPLSLAVHRSSPNQAALGPLKADSQVTRTFVPLYLHLPNVTTAITVHFVVITRGGIIYRWGATTQCPISSSANQIQTAPRNSKCSHIPLYSVNPLYRLNNAENYTAGPNAPENYRYSRMSYKNYPNLHRYIVKSNVYGSNVTREGRRRIQKESKAKQRNARIIQKVESAVDALLDRHLLRVMLPIKVTNQMCPDSHLVAYFYHNGELVSASKHFEMDECFANKVEANWLSRQVLPGSIASLQVSSPGPALCTLTALDTASKWYNPPVTVKEVLMSNLRKLIESHRNLTEYDAAGDCFLNAENPDTASNNMELTSSWLAAAGVRVLGDVTPRHCASSPMPLTTDEGTLPRSDFSESWLWRILPIDGNGTAVVSSVAPDSITRFEAGVLCLSKNGPAISAPAMLQVFREFFIHADSPRQLQRGDSTIIRYRLFNYLYEPLSIQIEVATDSHFGGPARVVESSCIAARSSLARRAELTARSPGRGRVSIRATALGNAICGSNSSARNVSDEVVIQVTVVPEGVAVHEHKSIMLCGRGEEESSKSRVSWSWSPAQIVPGTESLTVWATGDPTGPLLADADGLILLPRGCGEQNMARLATNLLALSVLDPRSAAATTAREHVARGFTRQLQYIHPSGGFSAFGSSDTVPSTWLTAFALRYLRRAYQVLWPGLATPPALDRAEKWLLSQQMENGCFRNEGQVFHRELKGGLNEDGEIASVALTAYVITSLVESTSPLSIRLLRNTLSCLRALPENKPKTPNKVYAQALLANAFMRLKRYEEELRRTNEASLLWERRYVGNNLEKDEEIRELMDLLKIASRNDDYIWWETSSLSTSVEATSYALLALRDAPAALRERGRAALRWLAAQRTAAGGFVSTQDTLVALEALTAWSSLQPHTHTNLTVTVQSSQNTQTVKLQPGAKIPDIIKMGTGDKISVDVEGDGCALVQATRSYNTLSAHNVEERPLLVQVAVHTDGPFDCDANDTYCFCAAIVETCVVWDGAFPEMALLEISLPGGYGVDASRLYSQLHKPDTLVRRIELSSNSGKVTMYLGAGQWGERTGRREGASHQCYSVHTVGPLTRTRPAYARILDYYRPTLNHTQGYTIPEDCPARVSHESNEYQASDNLFSKAKSLSDSGEILITHEFSFEDIPEGIPLEDPLYENLTMRDKEAAYIDRDEVVEKVQNIIREQLESYHNRTKSNFSEERNEIIDKSREELENNEIHKNFNGTESGDINVRNSSIDFNENVTHEIAEDNKNAIIEETYDTFEDKTISAPESQLSGISEQDDTVIETDKHNIEIREEHINRYNNETDNPILANFHIIDSEKDLDVPSGVEGPIPVMVPPPKNFIPPTGTSNRERQNGVLSRTFYDPYNSNNFGNVRFSKSSA